MKVLKKLLLVVAIVFLAAPLLYMAMGGVMAAFAPRFDPASVENTVVRVIDGDTFVVNVDGENVTVRLIGVDTPESVHSDESKNCEEGKIASSFTKELLLGKSIRLEYDVQKEDKYGRTLAYAYLSDGRMVQDVLLKKGYARVMTVQPNSSKADHFLTLQREARENEVGFWDSSIWD